MSFRQKIEKVKNFFFQFTWFFLVKPFIRTGIRKGDTPYTRLRKSLPLFKAQINLSKFFGVVKNIVYGDSNAGVFNKFSHMVKFVELTLGFGVGSTRWQDWYYVLTENEWLREFMKTCNLFEDLGGNDAIYSTMNTAEEYLERMIEIFPEAYRNTIPPVREFLIPVIILNGRTPEGFQKDVDILNELLRKKIQKRYLLDLNKLFLDKKTGEAKIGVLIDKDPVHYSKWAVNIIILYIFNPIERMVA